MNDPFEGSTPKFMVAEREYIKQNRATDPRLAAWKDVPDSAFEQMASLPKRIVDSYLISCWHMNEHESAALWKVYASANEAVCIQSTYRRLRLCLPQCVMIGEVSYIDYETQGFSSANLFNFLMHKRASFAHERELRAVFWEQDGTPEAQPYKQRVEPSGLAMEMDIPALIERTYVSPTAAPWFADLVQTMTKKCGFELPVSQSVLAAVPLY